MKDIGQGIWDGYWLVILYVVFVVKNGLMKRIKEKTREEKAWKEQ